MELTRYTGIEWIDKIIHAYQQHNSFHDPYINEDRPLTDMMDAFESSCMCEDISRSFLAFTAEQTQGGEADLWKDQCPSKFGFTVKLDLPHTVARLYPDANNSSHYFAVDFTAAQYGSNEFPLVREFNN